MAFLGPFLHLFAGTSQEGVLHWMWMSSFLDSLGWAMLPLFMGLGLLTFSTRLQSDNRTVLGLVSMISVAIGCFYLAYTLISVKDFTNFQYYALLISIAIFSSILVYYMHRAVKSTEERLLKLIASLSSKEDELAYEEHMEDLTAALKNGND
ncbi:hypothetical protein ULMS_15120 [Patiriisocius marinistellae]|uniref:Uncharacterized protein n=1 Tax=Patiriisocius marinistellae TaxID=2494560 RepID=A0A5J4FXW0_9FLAO|nr:hypothetical protein ULMS_15120 [Patiriisocius marinistellae]